MSLIFVKFHNQSYKHKNKQTSSSFNELPISSLNLASGNWSYILAVSSNLNVTETAGNSLFSMSRILLHDRSGAGDWNKIKNYTFFIFNLLLEEPWHKHKHAMYLYPHYKLCGFQMDKYRHWLIANLKL